MITDVRNLSEGTVIDSDICIVGAGAAGITLAMELIGHDFSVNLLESGGLDFEDDVQALNDGDCVSQHKVDLMWTRLRYFGGTTGHWGGNCAPLDERDFETRSWVPDSGWPISRKDLERFYPRAYRYCELPSDDYSVDHWAEISEKFRRSRIPVTGEEIGEKLFLKSPPTRFGDAYRADLAKPGSQCTVYLHANVVEIETGEDASEVVGLRTRDVSGRGCRFTARIFILASGIENARLLLLSNKVRPNGLGNDHDVVGRYFMAHTTIRTGRAMLSLPEGTASYYATLGWEQRFLTETSPFIDALQPSRAAQEREGILNSVVFFEESYEGEKTPGFVAMRRIAKQIVHGRMPSNLVRDLGIVVGDLDEVVKALYARSVGDRSYRILQTRFFCEQAPDRDSRVRLGDDVDALGQRKLVLDWRLNDLDKRTVIRTQKLLAEQFGALGIGRLQVEFDSETDPWPRGVDSSAHFMGTTRMSTDPRRGVVDGDCRVHGIDNLYVAGGSVTSRTRACVTSARVPSEPTSIRPMSRPRSGARCSRA